MIIQSNIVDESKKDLFKYSIKVNRQRMIPDRRDGLKPVHRRILDIMFNHLNCSKSYLKSARIVGSVLGISHPHGDSSVYDAMKPMTNWFEIKVPLIDPQGQFGTIQGDEAAAMRYTEAKLSEYALDCIINDMREVKNVVDWILTFDEKHLEPEYFPAAVPNLLINGAFGIGFGIKSEIPRHNLGEVIDATINLIKNPNYEVVLVPDHCMRVHIIDTNFKAICNKGRGTYTARAIIDIDKDDKGRDCLIVRSLPDLVFLNKIEEKIDAMVKDNSIQVTDIYEESDEFNLKYILVLKKGADPHYTRELLYKRTELEKRYTVNFEVLDKLEPIRMSYKSYLQSFIEFRKICKFRLYCNKLQDVDTKYHEKEAFIKVLQSGEIDKIIHMIRTRTEINDNELVEYLITTLGITDLQASYIINANIKKLSLGYLEKYIEESKQLQELINLYMNKILNEEEILKDIIEELKYFKKKYGKPRACDIISNEAISEIPKGEFRIIFTENNFVKKLPVDFSNGSFRQDTPKHIVKGCNTKAILLFDENGRVFRLPIHRIFVSDKNSNGTDIRSIVKNCTSNIIKVIYEPVMEDLARKTTKYYVVMVTYDGNIKKMDLDDFLNVPFSGLLYTKLENDIVKSINIYHESVDVVVFSKSKALRMKMDDIPYQRRNTKGMKSFSSGHAEGMSLVIPNSTDILVVTEKGYVNRFDSVALPTLGRNKSGANVIKLTNGDSINSIHSITADNTTLKVKFGSDTLLIDLNTITKSSSISKGERLIPLKTNNIISTSIK